MASCVRPTTINNRVHRSHFFGAIFAASTHTPDLSVGLVHCIRVFAFGSAPESGLGESSCRVATARLRDATPDLGLDASSSCLSSSVAASRFPAPCIPLIRFSPAIKAKIHKKHQWMRMEARPPVTCPGSEGVYMTPAGTRTATPPRAQRAFSPTTPARFAHTAACLQKRLARPLLRRVGIIEARLKG